MLILIADDDWDTVETQAVILRRAGYSALTCTAGKAVMPLVVQHRPEVLLLDLAMPGLNGFDVAMKLKENSDLRPKLLIAVTGFNDDGAKEMTAGAGFDFHLVKPVKLAELLTILGIAFPSVEREAEAEAERRFRL